MIVYDLKCDRAHVFEAWFSSAGDFYTQRERGLVACPICNSSDVERAPSRIAIGGSSAESESKVAMMSEPSGDGDGGAKGFDAEKAKAMLAAMAKAQEKAVAEADDVGGRFAEEARAMHYGEQKHRPIYGETDAREAKALHEEGVPAMPLLFPVRKRSDA